MGGIPQAQPEPIAISSDNHRVLTQLRDGLHEEIIGNYEAFVGVGDAPRTIDTTRWKLLRTEGELQAYREREDAPRDDPSSACQPQAWMAARSDFPRVLVIGSIPGSLDDAMYAHAFHDTKSLRTNFMYEKSCVDMDCSVLNTLARANDVDPFCTASVTWLQRTYPIVRDRTILTYSDVRLSHLSNGDRIGVVVTHSIRHNNFILPKQATRIMRVECSIATVFRQLPMLDGAATRVEVYTRHFLDPKGVPEDSMVFTDMANAFVAQETVKSLLRMAMLTDIALNKKLCFRMQQRLRKRLWRTRAGSALSALSIDTPGEMPQRCEQCDKKVGGLFQSSGRVCQLCDKLVCSRCLTKRELVIDATLVEKPFEFCNACVHETLQMPAIEVARAELRERQEQHIERMWQRKQQRSNQTESPTASAHERVRPSPVS